MNKRGLTLIELLAAVTILGIISVIAVISISEMIKQANIEECNAVVTSLKNATKEYVSDKRYVENMSSLQNIDVVSLINGGYFSKKITNPFTKEIVDNGNIESGKYYIRTELDDYVNINIIDIQFISCLNERFFSYE